MRASQERHPPDQCTKRLNVVVPIWQHIICAYCGVVLLTKHLSQNILDADSQLCKIQDCIYIFPFKVELGFIFVAIFLFSVQILLDPLWQI